MTTTKRPAGSCPICRGLQHHHLKDTIHISYMSLWHKSCAGKEGSEATSGQKLSLEVWHGDVWLRVRVPPKKIKCYRGLNNYQLHFEVRLK